MATRAELDSLLALMPFAAGLGITLDGADSSEVRGRLSHSPELCTAGGVLHGGVLMALADSLGGVCAYLNLPSGSQTATISSTTTFLRPVRAGEVTGTARCLHAGRSVIAVQTELVDGHGKPIARTMQSQAVLPAS